MQCSNSVRVDAIQFYFFMRSNGFSFLLFSYFIVIPECSRFHASQDPKTYFEKKKSIASFSLASKKEKEFERSEQKKIIPCRQPNFKQTLHVSRGLCERIVFGSGVNDTP